jgi:AbrB family looped-hinge helix DNA binding protein
MFKDIKFWGTVTVGTKGQIVIPAKAREKFKIKEGDQLILVSHHENHGIMLVKAELFEKMMQLMQSGISEALDNVAKLNKRGSK